MGPRIAVSLCGHAARRCVIAREQYLDAAGAFLRGIKRRLDALSIMDDMSNCATSSTCTQDEYGLNVTALDYHVKSNSRTVSSVLRFLGLLRFRHGAGWKRIDMQKPRFFAYSDPECNSVFNPSCEGSA